MKNDKLVLTSVLAEELGVGITFASALKRAAGFTGRFCDVATVRKWWLKHPDFHCRDVFHGKMKTARAETSRRVWQQRRAVNGSRPCNPSDPQLATVDKCGEQL